MIGKEITLKFVNTQAFLVHGIPVVCVQDAVSERLKAFTSTSYWLIRILNYFPNEGRIFAEIRAYTSTEKNFESNSINLHEGLKEAKIVTFKSINTYQLLETFGKHSVTRTPAPLVIKPHEPKKGFIPETFTIPIKKLKFKNGCISFERKLAWMRYSEELEIANPDIRPEFDAIKDYFANVLGTKKIQVKVVTHTLDEDIESIEIESPEIERITGDLIENVKLGFITKTLRNSHRVSDKSLFSMNDFFDEFAEKFKPDVFYSNEQQFIEDLIKISNSKHYNQLRFLSRRHSFGVLKIQFVPKPVSFVFLIVGKTNDYLVWETLDTEEATYIWRIQKDEGTLISSLKDLESAICDIKSNGKIGFLRKNDENFDRIYHDYSDEIEGFVKWKTDLEKLLN